MSWLLLAAIPAPAFAHGAVEGVGAFWNGMLHLVLSPVSFVALSGLGIAIAEREAAARPFRLLMVSLAAGFAIGQLVSVSWSGGIHAEGAALLAAGAMLLAPRIAPPPAEMLVVSTAGFLCAAALSWVSETTALVPALGLLIGAIAGLYYVRLGWTRIRQPWFSIAANIFGSWLTAAGAMLLALAFRPLPA